MSRTCRDCDGPLTRCQFCTHYHCDDESCMPVECARRWMEADEHDEYLRDLTC